MKFLDGYKTYLGAFGLICVGIGGILTQHLGYVQGATDIAMGIIAFGGRSFGQKILDVLGQSKPQ